MNKINLHNYGALQNLESSRNIFNDITQPLFEKFPFNHFAYNSFKQGKYYATLCTLLQDHYTRFFEQGLDRYLIPDFLIIPEGEKRIWIWNSLPSSPLIDSLKESNRANGISIFYRQNDVIEGFHFATDCENTNIGTLYIRDLDLIENFIIYFKSKSKDLFDFNDQKKLFLYQEDRALIFPELRLHDEYACFLQHIKPSHYNLFDNYPDLHLTPSEFSCLQLFSNGKAIKEIAQIKGISPRTIEAHLGSIRKKLGNDNFKNIKKIFDESIYSKMDTDNFFK